METPTYNNRDNNQNPPQPQPAAAPVQYQNKWWSINWKNNKLHKIFFLFGSIVFFFKLFQFIFLTISLRAAYIPVNYDFSHYGIPGDYADAIDQYDTVFGAFFAIFSFIYFFYIISMITRFKFLDKFDKISLLITALYVLISLFMIAYITLTPFRISF